MHQEQLRHQIDSQGFERHELALYLDVHPSDDNARAHWNHSVNRLDELERQYYAQTGKVWPMRGDRHGGTREWVDEPWPWENQY